LPVPALLRYTEKTGSMKEKVYFEFEAEIRGKQSHFVIEMDKETFIDLQYFAEIKNINVHIEGTQIGKRRVKT
jgi:hypothetical protein